MTGTEACDGTDFGGATCADEGLSAGTLYCTPDCSVVTSGCTNCGDGVADGCDDCPLDRLDDSDDDGIADGNEVAKPVSPAARAADAFWPQDPGVSLALAAGVPYITGSDFIYPAWVALAMAPLV